MTENKKLSHHLDELHRALAIIKPVGQVDGHDVIRRASVLDVAGRRVDFAKGQESVAPAAPAAPADDVPQLVEKLLAELATLEELGAVPEAWRRVASRLVQQATPGQEWPAGQWQRQPL